MKRTKKFRIEYCLPSIQVEGGIEEARKKATSFLQATAMCNPLGYVRITEEPKSN